MGRGPNGPGHRERPHDTPISVSGVRWLVRFEWAGAVSPDTGPVRTAAAYTLQDGLVVDLLSDNVSVVGSSGIRVYDSASLRCRNVDPKLNPWRPFASSYDFTMPTPRRTRDPIRRPIRPR